MLNETIALTIPAFRMRKPKDFNRNEIGIISMAIDATGVSNPGTALFTNSFFIPEVKKWSWVKFGGHGRIIYGPKKPGEFLYYNVLFVESDQDVRDFGATLKDVFSSEESSSVVKAVLRGSPVSAVLADLGELVVSVLSGNKNDLIFSTEGSFFRDTNPPYNAGDVFSTMNDFIECQIKVMSLSPEIDINNSDPDNIIASMQPDLPFSGSGSAPAEIKIA